MRACVAVRELAASRYEAWRWAPTQRDSPVAAAAADDDADDDARAMAKRTKTARDGDGGGASATATAAAAVTNAGGSNWAALKAKIGAGTTPIAKKRAAEKRAMEDVTTMDGRAGDYDEAAAKKPRVTGKNRSVTRVLALDCEMVGVGTDGKRSILARASVVNEDGHVILDTFVLPTERVVDYRTAVSGVRPKDLLSANGAKSFQKVQAQLSELFNGRILVGHSLKNDMKVLMLDHPKKDTRDTSLYHPLTRPLRSDERCVPGAPRGRGCRALRDLVAQHLGLVIQKGEHSSVDDARAALLLYQKFQRKWENSLRGREKKSSK